MESKESTISFRDKVTAEKNLEVREALSSLEFVNGAFLTSTRFLRKIRYLIYFIAKNNI